MVRKTTTSDIGCFASTEFGLTKDEVADYLERTIDWLYERKLNEQYEQELNDYLKKW